MPGTGDLARRVRAWALPLSGGPRDYDRLLNLVDGARFVLPGEASHGSHEPYRERAQIARCLIEEKGFRAVVVEADWPDAFRVNRFARGASVDAVIHVGRPRAAEPRERTVRWESAEPPETYPWLV